MRIKKFVAAGTFVAVGLLTSQAYAANEAHGGVIVGQFRPTYASDLKGEPELPATALLKGVYASFIKRNILIGSQVLFASTSNTDNTQGSQYSFVNASVHFGGLFRFAKAIDFETSLGIGLGQTTFANASATTPLSVQASYLSAMPQATLGVLLTQNFKLAVGGGYQYGYVYDVVQSGPSENFLEKATEKVTATGITVLIQFALMQ